MVNSSFEQSSIALRFIQSPLKSTSHWLSEKRTDDGAEGQWRINNKLYDFINFIQRHPGGEDWLEMTKGLDITELFETHHIRGKAELLLHHFYVRNAKEPRTYRFTFSEDGFYKTLKAKVADHLIVITNSPKKSSSQHILDLLLIITLLSVILAAKANSMLLSIIAGIFLAFLGIVSHNYLHQRDNWRMQILNLTGLNYREWRVSHVLSQHMYPNTLNDLEMPFLMIPKKFHLIRLFVWCFLIKLTIVQRTLCYFGKKSSFRIDHLITFIPPVLLYLFGSGSVFVALKFWFATLSATSFLISLILATSGHHHSKAYREKDELLKSLDFGIFQMNAVIDRSDVKRNRFLSLIMIGHHSLHQLFPTVDQRLLPHLNELFLDTCWEFGIHLREVTWSSLFIQAREKPISLKEMKF